MSLRWEKSRRPSITLIIEGNHLLDLAWRSWSLPGLTQPVTGPVGEWVTACIVTGPTPRQCTKAEDE